VRYILLAVLLVLMPLHSFGCSSSPSPDSETNQAKDFADAFIAYAEEVMLAHNLAIERLNKASDLLGNGEINTIEFRKRCYQTTLIHAYTLDYIDRKPRYEVLFLFLYTQDKAPSIGWCIPEDTEGAEARYESQLQDYIDYHYFAVSEAVAKIGPPKN